METQKVYLPSGKEIISQPSTFEKGRRLYQVILREAKKLNLDLGNLDVDANIIFQIGTLALSSEEIDQAIWEVSDKTLIDGVKVSVDYFKVVENREDYFHFLMEVAKVNLAPFMKSLFAQFAPLLETMKKQNQA